MCSQIHKTTHVCCYPIRKCYVSSTSNFAHICNSEYPRKTKCCKIHYITCQSIKGSQFDKFVFMDLKIIGGESHYTSREAGLINLVTNNLVYIILRLLLG